MRTASPSGTDSYPRADRPLSGSGPDQPRAAV